MARVNPTTTLKLAPPISDEPPPRLDAGRPRPGGEDPPPPRRLAEPPAAAVPRVPHNRTVDALRGVAVVAMVVGHTLDALLAADVRASEWAATYWRFRGVTAPLFLVVSGWALSGWVLRAGLTGWGLIRARLPRVTLLLAIGYLLRVPVGVGPGWLERGSPALASFLAFDALHCIAVSLLATVALYAVVESPRLRVVALTALAALVPLASAGVWQGAEGLPFALRQAVAGGAGAPFPLFPWAGYFFAGAAVGALAGVRRPVRRPAAWLLAGAAAAVLTAAALGLRGLPATSATLVLYRVGEVMMVAGLVAAMPARWTTGIAPLGRLALAVYVTHLVVLYGWARWAGLAGRIGPTLSLGPALATAALVLTASVVIAFAWRALWRRRPARRRHRHALGDALPITSIFGR